MTRTMADQMAEPTSPMAPMMDAAAQEQAGKLLERLFGGLAGTMDLFVTDLGLRLGLYEALRAGPATSSELARRTGYAERYVREWLHHQATAGFLVVDDPAATDEARRYQLPEAHAEVLLNQTAPLYGGMLVKLSAFFAEPIGWVAEAFRTDEGIPWSRYPGASALQRENNAPAYLNLLTTQWIPALPELDRRLREDPPARVADLACGAGVSSIELARAYPTITVDGFDNDDAAIALARRAAMEAGVDDRVRFEVRDLADSPLMGPYDLVTIFEAVHDLARPVEALRSARGVLAEGGWFLLMDENVGESFAEPGPLDAFLYATSVLLCLPNSLAERPSAATGTVMRRSTLEGYAREAGFADVEVLPIEHDFFRFYKLLA